MFRHSTFFESAFQQFPLTTSLSCLWQAFFLKEQGFIPASKINCMLFFGTHIKFVYLCPVAAACTEAGQAETPVREYPRYLDNYRLYH